MQGLLCVALLVVVWSIKQTESQQYDSDGRQITRPLNYLNIQYYNYPGGRSGGPCKSSKKH